MNGFSLSNIIIIWTYDFSTMPVVSCVGGWQTDERINDFENVCIKCGKMISEHPTTGRFHTVILFGNECAWNPDDEFEGFVKNTLKTSGYDLVEFGYE